MRRTLSLIILLLAPPTLVAQELPAAPAAAIRDAAELCARICEEVWPGWSAAPTQLLLISDSTEYYLPTFDAARPAWTRPRRFPPAMLATFPAVGGVPTIVIGTPAGSSTPTDRWVLTILHEHFHQLQYTRPDYYTGLNALGLARGDTTGMWALHFPFPYDSAPIQAAVKRWAMAMHAALSGEPRDRAARGARARESKQALDRLLAPDDRRYFDFQLWQEGVPRWIELAAARRGHHAGLVAEASLQWQERRLVNDLATLDLGRDRRVVVYALGAAAAELMEWEGSGWRRGYFERMFDLDPARE